MHTRLTALCGCAFTEKLRKSTDPKGLMETCELEESQLTTNAGYKLSPYRQKVPA